MVFQEGMETMYRIYNLKSSANVEVSSELGPFTVITHQQNLDLEQDNPIKNYFESMSGLKKRQLICNLGGASVLIAEGMMQWMVGDCQLSADNKGLLGYFNKKVRGKMTGQSLNASCFSGNGTIVLEPIDGDILLVDLHQKWAEGMVLDSSLFLACTNDVDQSTIMRTTASSAMLGNEGLFSMTLAGKGIAALRLPCAKEALVLIELENDTLKVDGNFAIAWSKSLEFTVDNAGKGVIASTLSKEGLVNTYKGTGKILLAPILSEPQTSTQKAKENE